MNEIQWTYQIHGDKFILILQYVGRADWIAMVSMSVAEEGPVPESFLMMLDSEIASFDELRIMFDRGGEDIDEVALVMRTAVHLAIDGFMLFSDLSETTMHTMVYGWVKDPADSPDIIDRWRRSEIAAQTPIGQLLAAGHGRSS